MSRLLNINYGAIFFYKKLMNKEKIWDFLFIYSMILVMIVYQFAKDMVPEIIVINKTPK